MKGLVVGAGGMGRAWAKNLAESEGSTLAGWIDVRPGAARASADDLKLDVPYTGENLKDAVQAIAPDFVVDVTPPEIHHRVTIEALGLGVPVLGEKPMSASMEDARAMVEASERAGKLYMVSQSRRWDGGMLAFRNLIAEELGGLGILNVDFYIGAHFGGFRDEMPSPLVLDMAIHTFDQARYLSNADPIAVYADEFNPSWSWYKGDVSATCIFEMSDGLRFTYRGSWCSEGLHTSWEGDWRAVGPKGSAIWEKNRDPQAETVVKSEGFHSEVAGSSRPHVPIAGGISGSLQAFLHALRTGETPLCECHDNIKSLAMVFAAMKSSREQRRVLISEV